MHSRYGPEKERLYSFLSSDSQNLGAFLRIFSASSLFDGKMSSFKNDIMRSLQLDPTPIFLNVGCHSLYFCGFVEVLDKDDPR